MRTHGAVLPAHPTYLSISQRSPCDVSVVDGLALTPSSVEMLRLVQHVAPTGKVSG